MSLISRALVLYYLPWLSRDRVSYANYLKMQSDWSDDGLHVCPACRRSMSHAVPCVGVCFKQYPSGGLTRRDAHNDWKVFDKVLGWQEAYEMFLY